MNLHEILTTKRDVESAMEIAGRGELRWLKLIEELDRLGYDIVKREVVGLPWRSVASDLPAGNSAVCATDDHDMFERPTH